VTNSFLRSVLNKAYKSKENLSTICFILPSQRAGIEIKKLIADRETESVRLPITTTLNSWKEEISKIYPAEKSELYLHLYRAYSKALGKKASSFEKFLSWANILLSDFNDIDNQLLNSQKVFKDLRSYAEIEHFSFLQEELSERQRSYRTFWMSLTEIYEHFRSSLLKNQIGHSGLIGRIASQEIDSYLAKNDFFFVAAGFNALSVSEQKILEKVCKADRGMVLFDCDPIYLENKNLKAGHFIRKFNRTSFGEVIESQESLMTKKMDVNIIHCPSAVIQARTIANYVKTLSAQEQRETAIILPDEDFLIELLSAIPRTEIDANITMGISLGNSTFYSWLEAIVDESSEILASRDDHAFLDALRLVEGFEKSRISKIVISKASSLDQLSNIASELLDFLGGSRSNNFVLKQAIAGCKQILKVLNQIKSLGFDELSPFRNLILSEVGQVSINILSEPDKKLQVMGLLESRSLGFKNVVICSTLEEYLPGKLKMDSFMPFEIRKHHGLPGNYLKEAAFAYNFYRLTHDARTFTLIYYDKDNTLSTGEKSRYINQLIYDLSRENQNINIQSTSEKIPLPPQEKDVSEIKKSPEVISEIKKYLKTGVSASSLNRYFADPLEWYYGYVLKLKEPERDVLDVAGFGSIVHKCIENLYKPFEKKLIHLDELRTMISRIPKELDDIFINKISGRPLDKGEVRISLEMANKMVTNFLKSEINQIEKTGPKNLIEGEIDLERNVSFNINDESVDVRLLGQADKVERIGQLIYIVDYKTGKVEMNDLTVRDWEMEELKKKPKSLQLFLYQYMAKTKWPGEKSTGQIITIPAPSRRNLFAKVKASEEFDELAFKQVLEEIFKEMLNPELPIRKDPDYDYAVFAT